CTGRLRITSSEEDGIARLSADVLCNAFALSVGNVLRNWATQDSILGDCDVSKTLRAALLCTCLPRVELSTWLRCATFHHDSADLFLLEDAEGGVLEEVGALYELDIKAQVWLIGAVVLHGIRVGHAWDRSGDLVSDKLPQLSNDLFAQGDDVFLVNEGHLNVQLSKFWLSVCTEVFVAVATCQLVVTLHASNHQQLLEQLWGLRQCVPGTWLQACWD